MFVSIGNNMILSVIWDKSAQVNFSKTNKTARTHNWASAICGLSMIYPKLHEKNHVITEVAVAFLGGGRGMFTRK